jgi:hypothetical protein
MNRLLIWGALAFALAAGPALAQSQHPYAGFEGRSIKALSEQQIADLRAGRGMGLALVPSSTDIPAPSMCSSWPIPWIYPTSSAQRCRSYSRP